MQTSQLAFNIIGLFWGAGSKKPFGSVLKFSTLYLIWPKLGVTFFLNRADSRHAIFLDASI
jgi:hypothetical protein